MSSGGEGAESRERVQNRQKRALNALPAIPEAISILARCLRTSWQEPFIFLTFPKGGKSSGVQALEGFATGKLPQLPLSPDPAVS